jgi:hypothetical protein
MAKAQSPHVLSQLIGSIYDCVLDPLRWHKTLEEINAAVGCRSSILYLFDRPRRKFLTMKIAGVDERYWGEVIDKYGPDIHRYAIEDESSGRSIDEPRLMSEMPRAVEESRYVQEVLNSTALEIFIAFYAIFCRSKDTEAGCVRLLVRERSAERR